MYVNNIYPRKVDLVDHKKGFEDKRTHIVRETKTVHFPQKHKIQADKKGFFSGYGSVFNVLDLHGDVVMPGAFSETLRHHILHHTQPKMLWQHKDGEVIGKWHHIQEDRKGLWVVGQLLLTIRRAREAYTLIREGVLTSLSIGYHTVLSDRCLRTQHRLVYQMNLVEISLVSFGANPDARVCQVKSQNTDF